MTQFLKPRPFYRLDTISGGSVVKLPCGSQPQSRSLLRAVEADAGLGAPVQIRLSRPISTAPFRLLALKARTTDGSRCGGGILFQGGGADTSETRNSFGDALNGGEALVGESWPACCGPKTPDSSRISDRPALNSLWKIFIVVILAHAVLFALGWVLLTEVKPL